MAFSNLHLKLQFTSRSPLVPNPGIDLSYFASSSAADITDVTDLVGHVTASLLAVPAGATNKPITYLSSVLTASTTGGKYEVYDVTAHLDGSVAGSPVLIGSFSTVGLGVSSGIPEGCALTVTLQAPYGTDVEFAPGTRPRSRDRGRIYFGPLANGAAFTTDTNARTVPSTAIRTDLCQWIKAINVYTTAPHSIPYNLTVWSRKNHLMKSLQEVWVDDRFDYQRRRAGKESTKTIVGLP
jgi:hypothetical protein